MSIEGNLSVLDAIYETVSTVGAPKIQKIVFVCVQHLLHTSVTLFETLIKLGAHPKNIFVIGKHYSTSHIVTGKMRSMDIQVQNLTPLKNCGEYKEIFNQDVSNMWQKVQTHLNKNHREIKAVVVLDDGGRCLEFIKTGIVNEWPVIGIEQTTAGLFNPAVLDLHVPFIDVASCAAKTQLEADLIVDVILEKIVNLLPKNKDTLLCGVIGIGVIGQSVVKKLRALGVTVMAYDKYKNNATESEDILYTSDIESVIEKSTYIFGCTGRDITENLDLTNLIHENKFFISCTSEDKEFLSLLKTIQKENNARHALNPLEDISWEIKKDIFIQIIKGGFPVNFDESGTCVPAHKIQLTRGLLLASLIQAVVTLPTLNSINAKGRIMLYPECQKFVAHEWLKNNSENLSSSLLQKFKDTEWITQNSGGVFYESDYLNTCFSLQESILL